MGKNIYEIVDEMKIGWNLGNSLEAAPPENKETATIKEFEENWGNPITTKEMILKVKETGFNTIRIPVTWWKKTDATDNYKIDVEWLKRVKEVVDYVYEEGMYVIINAHHEDDWLIPVEEDLEERKTIMKNIWTQVAEYFKDYDYHLLFETMNEVRLIGTEFEWNEGTKEARDIMTHRTQITGIEDVMTLEDALHFMLDSNYSRFPVYEENIDKVQGIVHLKDVCRECQNEDQRDKALKDIDGLIREVQYVPETRKIDELFRQMQHSKSQMVIVIDEYGQTAGLIAMEDILEEIVGDIKDEYDEEQNQIQQKGQDRFVIDGMSKLEDLEKQFGISFDEEFFDTMNGFMISKMDRIPEVGDQFSVEVDGYLFQIMKVKNHKIDKVTVRKLEKKDTENGEK